MGARIIVVDNDRSIRKLITYVLQRRDYEILEYAYADFKQTVAVDRRPDLIILDFNIRDDDAGWNLLQLLKMDDATAHIPILVITTTVYITQEVQDYLAVHFIQVVRKPFDFAAFLLVIQNVLLSASQAEHRYASDPSQPVLVIEDSAVLQDVIATVLRLEGYKVVTASSSRLAFDAISSYNASYSLILLDIQVPIVDNFEFLEMYSRQLRQHLPVIILTDEGNIRNQIFPAFVIGVLLKPFRLNTLLQMVEKYAQPA